MDVGGGAGVGPPPRSAAPLAAMFDDEKPDAAADAGVVDSRRSIRLRISGVEVPPMTLPRGAPPMAAAGKRAAAAIPALVHQEDFDAPGCCWGGDPAAEAKDVASASRCGVSSVATSASLTSSDGET